MLHFLIAFTIFTSGKSSSAQEIKTFSYGSHERQKNDGTDVVARTANNIADKGGYPSELYLMGHSAGAHTVAMLGLIK